jgi:pyrimidine operon attenuation protein/uracil phosphoribosyltransferase
MKNYILNQASSHQKLERMAFEIWEQNMDESEIILAGIRSSGSVVAKNVKRLLESISPLKAHLISISLDKKNPDKVTLSEDLDFQGKVIIVVDDVANSGKTMLYALQPFLSAHPKKIQTLILVERTHKAFPVNSDYVGLSVSTTLQEHIYVEVDQEGVLGAYLQ